MVFHSCSASGEIDFSKFSEPLPWIGLYIAAASLMCSLLMGIDTYHGFRRRKLWFPCRFFSLNATSLTLLSVATKLPVDLNTSMPRPLDQLTKLSGTVLLCTVMGYFITSLGAMNESELISNVIALGILVVTVIVNIGIQMSTGVIYVFLPEHAIIMFFMLVLLVILCSTALMVPTANKLLEQQYQEVDDDDLDSDGKYSFNSARKRVMELWMITDTSGQYVVGHSATCTASGAVCILSALVLLQAAIRSLVIRSLHFCRGNSDYTWSIIFVLISQAITIGVGNIAPAVRWFDAIIFRITKRQRKSCKSEFKVEKYWVHRLEEWKEKPLPSYFGNRTVWKILHNSKDQILSVIILVQNAAVLASKLIGLSPMSWLSSSCRKRGGEDEEGGSEQESESNVDLTHFAPYLEGDVDLVPLMMNNGREDIHRWISKGKSIQQDNLLHLLINSQSSQEEVLDLELSRQVKMLGAEDSPPEDFSSHLLPAEDKCRPLLVVTLTSIAIAIAQPCIEKGTIKSLQRAVNEGLRYIRVFDQKKRGWINMRRAADIVWPSIDFYDSWLGNDLKKLARREDTAATILKRLADIGKKYFLDHTDEEDEDPYEWPPKVAAAESMYRLCETILLQRLETPDRIFQVLQKTIADRIAHCLKVLPGSIVNICFSPSIESREERIREAAYLLGELEKILTKEEIKRYLKEIKTSPDR